MGLVRKPERDYTTFGPEGVIYHEFYTDKRDAGVTNAPDIGAIRSGYSSVGKQAPYLLGAAARPEKESGQNEVVLKYWTGRHRTIRKNIFQDDTFKERYVQ